MLQVEEIEISALVPWEKNPRKNDHAVETVARSIKTFGFNVPIVCDQKLKIVAGHTRLKAAKKLGLEKVPVIRAHLNDVQRKAFAVADNKAAEIADWDFPRLQEVLGDLQDEDLDFTEFGYSDEELTAILSPEQEPDWDTFDADLAAKSNKIFALFPVKLERTDKDTVRKAVLDFAKRNNIHHSDTAVVAGLVLLDLVKRMS